MTERVKRNLAQKEFNQGDVVGWSRLGRGQMGRLSGREKGWRGGRMADKERSLAEWLEGCAGPRSPPQAVGEEPSLKVIVINKSELSVFLKVMNKAKRKKGMGVLQT